MESGVTENLEASDGSRPPPPHPYSNPAFDTPSNQMERKTKENIAKWVATAVSSEFDVELNGVRGAYVSNAGDYDRVAVTAPGMSPAEDEIYSATVDDRSVQYQVLERRSDDEYLFRVKVE